MARWASYLSLTALVEREVSGLSVFHIYHLWILYTCLCLEVSRTIQLLRGTRLERFWLLNCRYCSRISPNVSPHNSHTIWLFYLVNLGYNRRAHCFTHACNNGSHCRKRNVNTYALSFINCLSFYPSWLFNKLADTNKGTHHYDDEQQQQQTITLL